MVRFSWHPPNHRPKASTYALHQLSALNSLPPLLLSVWTWHLVLLSSPLPMSCPTHFFFFFELSPGPETCQTFNTRSEPGCGENWPALKIHPMRCPWHRYVPLAREPGGLAFSIFSWLTLGTDCNQRLCIQDSQCLRPSQSSNRILALALTGGVINVVKSLYPLPCYGKMSGSPLKQ